MITKKAGKPAAKDAAKPVAKAICKSYRKKPIDLKSPEKPGNAEGGCAASRRPQLRRRPPRAPRGPTAAPRPSRRRRRVRPRVQPAAKFKRQTNGAVKVGVVGCAGRMGQMLLKMLINAPGIVVVGGTERRGSIGARPGSRRPGRGRPARHLGQRRSLPAVRRRGRGGGFHQPDGDGAARADGGPDRLRAGDRHHRLRQRPAEQRSIAPRSARRSCWRPI